MDTKFPKITVQLSGGDGNVYGLIGKVWNALENGGVSGQLVSKFVEEAMDAEDYDGVIKVCMNWVEVE